MTQSDDLCSEIEELFRTCSAKLTGAHMALYPSCYQEMVETFCKWFPSYQSIRDTKLGQALVSLDLFKKMNGAAAYAAWTVATLIYMRTNRDASEIIVPFGSSEEQRRPWQHSLIYGLELPYAVKHMPNVVIKDFFTGLPIGRDEVLNAKPSYVEDFMEGAPCDIDHIWGAMGNKTIRPDVTQRQRKFFTKLYHRYASLDRA